MLNKCHHYAQIASLLCSVIINIKINKRPQKCKWKQSEEAADNFVELELLEAIFFNTLLAIKHTEHYINWLQGNIDNLF